MRTYTIELQIELDEDEQRYDAVKETMRRAAQEIFTTASMLAGKRKPAIAFHSKDFFHGNEELSLTEPETT